MLVSACAYKKRDSNTGAGRSDDEQGKEGKKPQKKKINRRVNDSLRFFSFFSLLFVT